ncbi:NUDIX hydrolase [Bacillus suaedaesalsae]|uniref:NUDIX hydrolase n=1 Tax=Bacillus suaedaesalsae TaxID=2810349 RepID=A0ABS2DJY7_9BACI|nr:NUDIX hydrolase [Bacillus suaedaesalsae]MBM6618817.1 NUDIX hydrolase [Bacillus suaedaesalsae]
MEYAYCPRCGMKLMKSETGAPMCPTEHYTQNQAGAVAGIILQNDSILLEQRAGATHFGKWALPGGIAELGETPEDALVREVLEETGLVVSCGQLIGAKGTPDSIIVFFEAIILDGELNTSSESLQVRWFPIGELPWEELAFSRQEELLKEYFHRKGDL